MKRPLLLFSLFLIVGIYVAQFGNLPLFIMTSMLVMSALSIVYLHNKKNIVILIGALIFFFAGAAEFTVINKITLDKFKEFSGKDMQVLGFVCTEPDIKESKTVYTVRTDEIKSEGKSFKIKGKLLVTVPNKDDTPILEYGMDLTVNGKISIPDGKRIPGGFDYRRHLLKSGVSATVYTRGDSIKFMDSSSVNPFVKVGMDLRKRIIGTIKPCLPKEQAALLCGMLIGFTEDMSDEMVDAFSDAGLSHLTAVSGMNIAFIVFPLVFVFKRMRLSQKASNITIIGILIMFLFITGFSPSVTRAVIMAVIILIGQLLRRETDIYTSISFALILLLLYNPYTLFDIGFQLSFAATLSLVLFYKYIKSKLDFKFLPSFVSDVMAATLAAQLGVVPISTMYFNKISIISLISNLVVVPLVEVITILGIIMVIIGQISTFPAELLGLVCNTFLSFILYVAKISSEIPFAVIKITTPSIFGLLIYYLCIIYFLWLKPTYEINLKPRYYVISISIITLIFTVTSFIPKDLKIVFIDVGEGDSQLIVTSDGKTILVDGGGFASKTDFKHNMGDYAVVPFLYDYGVARLDMVISTHGDDDHLQGLLTVFKDIRVDNLIIADGMDLKPYVGLLKLAEAQKTSTKMCKAGDEIVLDSDTRIKVISPIDGVKMTKSPENNGALVFKLNYKGVNVLFTGDIEKEAEKILLDNNADLKANVLKVAHHGSDTSTTEGFLNAVGPNVAIISVGKNNSFGHPSKHVIDRLQAKDVNILRTDIHGTIIMSTNGKDIRVWKTLEE
ncbi:MAG TPA: DNA internalization-related competence protein ComEC/Rec2 [Pseudobacteroides sp.]|uniref:DNA internalization-related competence protein ComEC/Rec2 n=1 Tax=Pseudobacteroides sp. TaxID=1968840 RepID=UPI002F93C738